ncbi:sodium-coupled monocarboxylate transporter 2-like [Neocloeon triangulifer]|uniref:sodium-coupled monocarboxylate transporter 2-like n=1 Tax=Neocloeon triangulifer TaxID=2078957 RepID=UPI00286F8EEC|nr:sodium-coupled monocarboxylate transporter 2-like [Neocloeon triangulifer]XP_059470405.1 sodium-coupled monocarboxylate transporter 2-like [Neocloeon triangulifer]
MDEECSANSLERHKFGWEDYLVFAAVLAVSMGIGVFYGCFKGKQKTASEFLMGNRQMNFWTLGASLTVGFTSAIALLGNTAEMYNFGTQYSLTLISFLIMVPVTSFLYLPTFRGLGITSIYEYFDRRFCNKTRLLMSSLFVVQSLLYLSVVVYAPALALRQVTGFNVIAAAALIFTVCVIYSSLGGIKAVVWSDTFQFTIIVAALLMVVIRGAMLDGGPAEIWQDAYESGRIEFLNVNPDPRIRHSFWTVIVGSTFYWLAMNCATQSSVQRLMTAPSNKHATWALCLSSLGMIVIYSITFYVGLVMYNHFQHCDPLLSKQVEATDQLLPLYVMEVAGSLPGLPGLFVAGVFSAALSTVASGLNALAASTLRDILAGGFNYKPTDAKGALISKGLSALYGLLGFALIFLVMQLGGVLQVAISLNGMLAGAALGTFTLGMYIPWCNRTGAIVGTIVGLATSLWLCIGAQVAALSGRLVQERKIVGTDCNCTVILPEIPNPDEVFDGYRISYLYYSPIAFLVTIVIGVIVSGITGFQKPESLDPELLSSLIRGRVKRHIKEIQLETCTEIDDQKY